MYLRAETLRLGEMREVGGVTGTALGALAACGLALTALGGATAPAEATPPGTNGKIAFVHRDAALNDRIAVINPDGTGETRLTTGFGTDPSFSADGTKIVFRAAGGITVMNADGSGPTSTGVPGLDPSFSPDGAKIVYWTGSQIAVMNANGSSPTNLTTSGYGGDPAFSPDGTKIAYADATGIWRINANGTRKLGLFTPAGRTAVSPNWSPDGARIAFASDRDSGVAEITEIYVMNADGTGVQRLTTQNPSGYLAHTSPSFSPDGTKIVFSRGAGGLVVMNADGTGQTTLATTAIQTAGTDWQPLAAPPPASPGPPVTWNAEDDFIVGPGSANPSPDRYGNPGVWRYLEAPIAAGRVPSGYSLMTDNTGGNVWRSTSPSLGAPAVWINLGGNPYTLGLLSHPETSRYSIIGWRSPIAGAVRVHGAFADADPACGNGVAWYIDQGVTGLASGSFGNSGSQSFDTATTVAVGDFLYFVLDPAADFLCDNTKVDVTIDAVAPPPAPAVSGLSPASGVASGGTSVTITGSNLTGATAVSFGGTAASSFTVDSATRITATSPGGPAGVASVSVTTPAGTSADTAVDDFTYLPPPPAVSGIAPASGPTVGGTSITVSGTDLAGATAVTFGGTAATSFSVDSPTRVTALSPARPPGSASVAVTTPGGTSADTPSDDFTYSDAPPAIAGLAPVGGPVAGGTSVTISGSGFSGTTSVSFGGVEARSFTVDSSGQVTAVAPAHAAGTVDVSVTTPAGTSADTAADDFTYTEAPQRLESADLGVSLSGPRILVPGRRASFTVSVVNRGPGTATTVRVNISLPAQLSLDSITSAEGQCSGPDPAICRFDELRAGFAGTIGFSVTPSGSGEGIVSVAVGGAEADPDTSNQAATLPVAVGCARSFTLDTVTVTAECIASEGELLAARGDVRLSNGTRILTAGTQASAPLLIDPAAHTIRLAPLDGGGARSGVLVAGTREVVAGPLVIHTPATGDPNSGLTGLAWVEGASDLRVKLSSWSFLNSAANTLVYLVPSAADGGALVVGRLTLPFYIKDYEGLLSLQVRSNGSRTMRAGTIRIGEFLLPGTPFQMKKAELAFLDGGDTFRGKAIFGSRKLLGELIVDPVVVTNGKLHDFRAVYDGTGCEKCGPKDPGLAPPPKSGEKPSPGKIVIRLVYAELNGVNLQNVKYEPPAAPAALSAVGRRNICTKSCPAPPEVNGKVVVSALDNKVVGIGQLRYKLSGRLTMDGKIFFAPAMPSSFKFPAFAQGVAPYADFLKHAVEFAEARAVFDPPMFWVDGSWRVDQTGFIRANFGLGFDPPHFTGEGGVEFRVPENSPIFPGKSLGGAQGLISDKAGAGQARLRVCAPNWLGGGCITYFIGAALVWKTLNFQFGHNVDDYRTVGNSTVRSLGERGFVRSAIDSFVVAPGVEFAAIRLRSAQGVPDVRLESPAVGGNRLSLTLGGSDDPGNATGALAYAVPDRNEVVFVVAKPPAGTWRIDTRGGVAVTAVELGRGLPDPELSPTSRLPTKASTSVELRWATTNPGRGAIVDLWAERTGEASVLIAAEQPATGTTTWRLDRVPAGSYAVKATLSRDGVPFETRFWPGIVGVTDVEGPPAPARAVAIAAAPGAHVRWMPAAGAEAYRIVARPVPASAGAVVEFGVQASALEAAITLAPGLRYAVAVQTVDRDSRRSPEIAAGVVEVIGAAAPPLLAGEPPNGQLGAPWGFAPVVENLAGGRVALRLVRGPRGMRIRGRNVLWTPRTQGRHTFVLEARNDAGRARRMTFSVLVAPRGTALAAPARGIAVRPTSVTARRATTLTLAAGRIGAATVLLDGRRVASRRIDAETRRITVRCLRAGVHRLEIRRADGTRVLLRRAFTVVGPGC